MVKLLRGPAAACTLLLFAACGGGDETADAAAPAKSDTTAVASGAAPASPPAAAAPGTQPAPGTPPVAAVLDSAMTPAEAAKVVEKLPVQGPVNVDVLEDYQLTMPKVRQLVQAGQNLIAAQARNPQMRESMHMPSLDPNALYQRVNEIPEAREAVTSAGLSPREYATVMAALLQAIMVHELRAAGRQPPAEAKINEANVRFVGEHMQEIRAMMGRAGAGAGPPRS